MEEGLCLQRRRQGLLCSFAAALISHEEQRRSQWCGCEHISSRERVSNECTVARSCSFNSAAPLAKVRTKQRLTALGKLPAHVSFAVLQAGVVHIASHTRRSVNGSMVTWHHYC